MNIIVTSLLTFIGMAFAAFGLQNVTGMPTPIEHIVGAVYFLGALISFCTIFILSALVGEEKGEESEQ
ncbi:hypothetical protein ACWX0P_27875 [Vibrio mediterranei]|uniref:hypothetical protein n=1 Tax=Vibrio mediterranei TaxID=689 RepID=UPI001EFE025D|nr:hypothetical protein [Vibrio mediterranei]MCG9660869.1 hypothetical protein [Vibrio mediterranei]